MKNIPMALYLSEDDQLVFENLVNSDHTMTMNIATALQIAQVIFKIRDDHFPEVTVPPIPTPNSPVAH